MQWQTSRLIIDTLQADDAAALFAYRSDPQVARYQGWQPAALEQAVAFIAAQAQLRPPTPDSWMQRAIRLRESGELIGDLGLHFPADLDAAVEFGISLTPAHQRCGYAFEAVQAVLDWVFTTLGRHRVCASVDPRNQPSIALLRALGMRQEAHFRESLKFRGEWVDDMVFGLLAREWPVGQHG